MRTPKTKTTAEQKPVTYKDLRALRIAKSSKKLPRGLKVDFSLTDNTLTFTAPRQGDPVMKTTLRAYVESCLKADGFKIAGFKIG